MHRYLVGLALGLLPTVAVRSAEPAPPPTQQLLSVDEAGQWQLMMHVTVCTLQTRNRTVTKRIPETKTVTDTVDGKPVEKTVTQYKDVAETQQYTVCVPVYQTVTKSIPASALKAFETDGRVIPLDKLRSRVGNEALVVASATADRISDGYADLFKPGTIVIALEQVRTPAATVAPSTSTAAPGTPAAIPQLPRSPAPEFVMLGRNGPDEIVVRRISESTSPITGMAVFTKGTATEQAPVPMMQTVRRSEAFTLAARHLHFNLGDSVDVPFERIKERIARESAVVYSTDGETIDPFWLQNLKSTTLVVTGPQLPLQAPGSGSAAPAMIPAPVRDIISPAPAPAR